MKLLAGLAAAALAGLAAVAEATRTAQDPAPVFLLRSSSSSPDTPAPPQLPRQIARKILLQRAGADHSSLLEELPECYDPETWIAYVRRYGKPAPGLFAATNDAGRPLGGPAQLVLLVEGVTPEDVATLQRALPETRRQPAFTIRDPPSSRANRYLVETELAQAGVVASRCGVASAFDLFDAECWDDGLFVGSYEAKKPTDTIAVITKNMLRLLNLVDAGDVEAMILLMPESSRSSPVAHWTTTASQPLRARAAEPESVIVDDEDLSSSDAVHVNPNSPIPAHAWASPSAGAAFAIPACFQSFNSCVAQTANCSGHGACRDKYALAGGGGGDAELRRRNNKRDGDSDDDAAPACFACHCFSTLDRPEDEGIGLSTTHWAGGMCQKEDKAVQFWLIVSLVILLAGAASVAVGLLFSVGEEPLPGVIGAGVIRTK